MTPRALRLLVLPAMALLGSTAALGQAPDSPEAKQAAPATALGQSPIQSRQDKISYALGVDMGKSLQQQKNEINVDLLMRALTDALAGKPLLLSDAEVVATLKRFEEERKHDYDHAKAMVGARNQREADTFFSENAKKEGVVALPSGLQYKVLKQGDGKQPTIEDHVVCQYRGTLVDGTEFDNSYKRSQPATLPVRGVLRGWTQALQLMPVGSKWQIFLPPQLAYGDKIVRGIGPNAMLIFEVELMSIQEKPQAAASAAQPGTAN